VSLARVKVQFRQPLQRGMRLGVKFNRYIIEASLAA
jgi:hypothetical protein